jgi:hypothetical protein
MTQREETTMEQVTRMTAQLIRSVYDELVHVDHVPTDEAIDIILAEYIADGYLTREQVIDIVAE